MKKIKESDKGSLAELFLKNFINAIIERESLKYKEEYEDIKNNIKKQFPRQIQRTTEKIDTITPHALEDLTEQLQHINPQIRSMSQISQEQAIPSMMNQNQTRQNFQFQPSMFPAAQNPTQKTSQQPKYINSSLSPLGKLIPFLKDPSIKNIECRGPNKNILVTKRGVKQVTQINLESNEIESIMKEVSEKTRIPIIQGLFKAALGNLIFSAVISDFVGTSFNIEKIPSPLPPRPIFR